VPPPLGLSTTLRFWSASNFSRQVFLLAIAFSF
jgi:hypothetical protein